MQIMVAKKRTFHTPLHLTTHIQILISISSSKPLALLPAPKSSGFIILTLFPLSPKCLQLKISSSSVQNSQGKIKDVTSHIKMQSMFSTTRLVLWLAWPKQGRLLLLSCSGALWPLCDKAQSEQLRDRVYWQAWPSIQAAPMNRWCVRPL